MPPPGDINGEPQLRGKLPGAVGGGREALGLEDEGGLGQGEAGDHLLLLGIAWNTSEAEKASYIQGICLWLRKVILNKRILKVMFSPGVVTQQKAGV